MADSASVSLSMQLRNPIKKTNSKSNRGMGEWSFSVISHLLLLRDTLRSPLYHGGDNSTSIFHIDCDY